MNSRHASVVCAALLSATVWAVACGGSGTTAASVTLSPATQAVAVGDRASLAPDVRDTAGQAMADVGIDWTSSDSTVATVDSNGIVIGVSPGRATVTATVGASQGHATIAVGNPDRAALAALYAATNGEGWYNSANWLTDAPLVDWYGVQTRGGEVLIVSLVSNGLIGTIPPEIGLLSTVSLHLGDNRLNGQIPPELAGVFKVDDGYFEATLYGPELDLGGNELTGAIPPELGAAALRYLDLSDNDLTGRIPPELGSLRAGLNLSGNRLTGPIPPGLDVGAGPEGEGGWLDLSSNQLTGAIPPNPGGGDVGYLDLSNNLLTGAIPPELGTWAMTTLDVSGNQLTGRIPLELGDLAPVDPHVGEPVLVDLVNLSDNRLTGPVPPELGYIDMWELDLSNNQLTGPLPESFLQLENLKTLNLSGNDGLCIPATGPFIEWIGQTDLIESATCAAAEGAVTGAAATLEPHEYELWEGEWYEETESSLEDNIYLRLVIDNADGRGFRYQLEDRQIPYGPNAVWSEYRHALFDDPRHATDPVTGHILVLSANPSDRHARVIRIAGGDGDRVAWSVKDWPRTVEGRFVLQRSGSGRL